MCVCVCDFRKCDLWGTNCEAVSEIHFDIANWSAIDRFGFGYF